jgi:hypothetical protein
VLISEGFAPLSDDIIRQTTPTGRSGCSGPVLVTSCSELGATRLRTALLDYYAANLCVGTRPYEAWWISSSGSTRKAALGHGHQQAGLSHRTAAGGPA